MSWREKCPGEKPSWRKMRALSALCLRLKSFERRKGLQRFPRRAPRIDRRLRVGVAEGHAAKQHQVRRQGQELAHGALPGDPGFLRASVQAIAAGEHHDGLDEA